ncbi:MAG: hypothetical protein ACYSYL_15535 [Planctomycetota bacterium]
MNRSKILWVAVVTTLVGVLAYSFAIRCLKLAKPANHAEVAAPTKPPKVAGKSRESDEAAGKEVSVVTESDAFANSVKHSVPTLLIQSSINGGPWVKSTAIYPLKGQKVALKVDKISGDKIRWYQIIPDTSKIYKNANMPWEKDDAYKWIGLAKIDYQRKELTGFQGRWQIEPFGKENDTSVRDRKSSSSRSSWDKAANSKFYHEDVGSFWFQVEVKKEGVIYRSAGIEDSDKKGLSPKVFRVSVRDGEGYIGYLTSFFNVPALFGSVTYQSNNYIGVDCADVLVAANYNVAMLVSQWAKVQEFDLLEGIANKQLKWGRDVRPGYFIAVRYGGSKQYQHIGALFSDANLNGVLDGDDLIIHAGPVPLHCSYLREGNFDGHVVILQP